MQCLPYAGTDCLPSTPQDVDNGWGLRILCSPGDPFSSLGSKWPHGVTLIHSKYAAASQHSCKCQLSCSAHYLHSFSTEAPVGLQGNMLSILNQNARYMTTWPFLMVAKQTSILCFPTDAWHAWTSPHSPLPPLPFPWQHRHTTHPCQKPPPYS